MKTRGLVVELELNEAVIMAETGEFIICNPRPGMAVGDVVEVSIWEQKQVWRGLQIGLSGAAIFIFGSLLGLGIFFNGLNQVFAHVDVDVHNVSLALALNRELHIAVVKPLNAEAKEVLQKVDFQGKSVKDGLEMLVRSSLLKRKAYVAPKVVLVTFALKPTGGMLRQDEKLRLLSQIGYSIPQRIPLTNQTAVNVKTLMISEKDGQTAHQMKLSMGKYYFYQKARRMGSRLTLKKVRTLSGIRLIGGLEQMEAALVPGRNGQQRSSAGGNVILPQTAIVTSEGERVKGGAEGTRDDSWRGEIKNQRPQAVDRSGAGTGGTANGHIAAGGTAGKSRKFRWFSGSGQYHDSYDGKASSGDNIDEKSADSGNATGSVTTTGNRGYGSNNNGNGRNFGNSGNARNRGNGGGRCHNK